MPPIQILASAVSRVATLVLLAVVLAAGPPGALAQTVQPGAPGQPSRTIDAEDIRERAAQEYSSADVLFMQHMIVHHAQAVEMTGLVPERTKNPDILALARRIEASQADEIAMMQRWLEERDEDVPQVTPTLAGDPHPAGAPVHHGDEHVANGHDHPAHTGEARPADHHETDHQHHPNHHGQHDHHGPTAAAHDGHAMAGMLSSEQMARLANATGIEFDRLFLESMIFHHEGALTMVDDLFTSEGAGQETAIFQFASHVDSDQRGEIARMRAMLGPTHHPDHPHR